MSLSHTSSRVAFVSIIVIILHIANCLQWQSSSILPTDLVGAQIGIYGNTLHLINGVYNATKLNYSENNDLVLWLTIDLSPAITITSSSTSSFSITPTSPSWNIQLQQSSSLHAGFFCYSKCSAQINNLLYVISAENTDDGLPNGKLIVYNLATQQLLPPPYGLTDTPLFLNGGTCVVHNDTHLFSIGGYNTQCPTNKFDDRCDDPESIYFYDTTTRTWSTGAILPDSAKIDSAGCAINKHKDMIYIFGGYNKFEDALSNKVIKYDVNNDIFVSDLEFNVEMRYRRSEFGALVNNKKNHVYLIGGAVNTVSNTGKLIEVFDMNQEMFIDVTIDGLSKSVRWYGSNIYAYNNTIDLLMVIGGHTGNYLASSNLKQNMTDIVQYLTINNNTEYYTDFPTWNPTGL